MFMLTYNIIYYYYHILFILFNMDELDGPAVSVLGVRTLKLSNVRKGQSSDGWPKFIILF
jgi:hypothetical protein